MGAKVSSKQLAYMLIAIGVVLAICAVVLFVRGHHPAVEPPHSTRQTPAVSQPAPTTTKPSTQTVAEYTVAPDLPKYITIPAISLTKARILSMGQRANGEIAVPGNIHDTGWYKASSKPGQPGAMFIFGHLSNWQSNGAFHDLKKLKPGDAITITRGDNQTYTYRVTKNAVYPAEQVDMNAALSPVDASKPGLNLMTCDGKVIQGTSDFTQRLVVFASLSE